MNISNTKFDFLRSSLEFDLMNNGHIPTGEKGEFMDHVAIFHFDDPSDTKTSHIVNKFWIRNRIGSMPSGFDGIVTTQILGMDKAAVDSGHQAIVDVGTLTYNDGFSDTPDQVFKYCIATLFYSETQHWNVIQCDWSYYNPLISKADEYPSTKYQKPGRD